MSPETQNYLDDYLKKEITKNTITTKEIAEQKKTLESQTVRAIESLGKTPYLSDQNKQQYLSYVYRTNNINDLAAFQGRINDLHQKCLTHDHLLKQNSVFYDLYGTSFEKFIEAIPDINQKTSTLTDNINKLPTWIAKEKAFFDRLKTTKEKTPAIYNAFVVSFLENINNQKIYKDAYLKELIAKHENLIKKYEQAARKCSFFADKDVKGLTNWFKKITSFAEMEKACTDMEEIAHNLNANEAELCSLVRPCKHLCADEKNDILTRFRKTNLKDQSGYLDNLKNVIQEHAELTEKYQELLTHEQQAKHDHEFFALSFYEKKKFLADFEKQNNNLEIAIPENQAINQFNLGRHYTPEMTDAPVYDEDNLTEYQPPETEENIYEFINEQIVNQTHHDVEALLLGYELQGRIETNEYLSKNRSHTAEERTAETAATTEEKEIRQEYNEATGYIVNSEEEAREVEEINLKKLSAQEIVRQRLKFQMEHTETKNHSQKSFEHVTITTDNGDALSAERAKDQLEDLEEQELIRFCAIFQSKTGRKPTVLEESIYLETLHAPTLQ